MKFTPMDDLQIGSWITVIDFDEEEQQEEYNPFQPGSGVVMVSPGGQVMKHPTPDERRTNNREWKIVDGKVYQIHAMDLPFIVVWCPVMDQLLVVHSHGLRFRLMTKEYVDIFVRSFVEHGYLRPLDAPGGRYRKSVSEDVTFTPIKRDPPQQASYDPSVVMIGSPPTPNVTLSSGESEDDLEEEEVPEKEEEEES